MNKKQIALAVLLADFVALTAYALYHHGYLGLFMYQLANAAGVQVLVDLVVALSIVMVWMWHDARQHGVNPLPYVLLTLGLGSIGPLVYLVRRFGLDPVVAPESVLPSRGVAPARA
jgi:hypothetical protein